jgi:hypothetical protein
MCGASCHRARARTPRRRLSSDSDSAFVSESCMLGVTHWQAEVAAFKFKLPPRLASDSLRLVS